MFSGAFWRRHVPMFPPDRRKQAEGDTAKRAERTHDKIAVASEMPRNQKLDDFKTASIDAEPSRDLDAGRRAREANCEDQGCQKISDETLRQDRMRGIRAPLAGSQREDGHQQDREPGGKSHESRHTKVLA